MDEELGTWNLGHNARNEESVEKSNKKNIFMTSFL